MLDHIPADKDVLRKWQKAGFMENRKPAVSSAVAYRHLRDWQRSGEKLPGQ
jgi:hypothetical protein